MTIERKRQLNEVLMRRHPDNADGTPGAVGVSIAYITWMEEDGIAIEGSHRMDAPMETDWQSAEVQSIVSAGTASARATIASLNAKIELLNTQNADYSEKLRLADMALTEAKNDLTETKSQSLLASEAIRASANQEIATLTDQIAEANQRITELQAAIIPKAQVDAA